MAYSFAAPQTSGTRAATRQKKKNTHCDNDRVLPLKLGNVSVASGHLGAVQGPKTAHHFDGALRRVGHLPRCTNGNSPTKKKIKCILDPRNGRGGQKGRPSPKIPISGSEKGDSQSCAQAKDLCFPLNHFPLLLRSHDTGGSAAGHLTPPAAAVDVVHNDVTPPALPVLL